MGRNYEKYIEIFTVGNCWNLLVTSSYLLVMLIWPPKDEPKRGSVPGCFVISDWNMPCPCCPTGPHRGPPGFPPGHWGEDPPQVSGKFHASPRKTPSDAIRQTSHLTSHPHFCPKSSKSCLIMSHHVSSCLIMSLCFGDANAGTQMQTIRMMTMMAHTACCSQQSHGRPTASRHPFSVHWGAWESLFEAQLRAIVCPVSFHIFHGFAHVSIPFLFHVFPCKSWWALHRVRILVSRSTIAWKDFKPSRSARTTSRFPLRTTKMMKHQYQTVSMCFVWSNFSDSNFWISDFSSKLSKLLSC